MNVVTELFQLQSRIQSFLKSGFFPTRYVLEFTLYQPGWLMSFPGIEELSQNWRNISVSLKKQNKKKNITTQLPLKVQMFECVFFR